jgi:transposase
MAGIEEQAALFPSPASGGVLVINDRCLVRTQDGHRVVIVAGVPLTQYTVGDAMAEAHAMVQLVAGNWVDQKAVARAFGRTARTVRRQQRRFEEGGLAALGRASGYPRGRPRLPGRQQQQLLRWKEQGQSNREIAQRLGVSEKAIRNRLRRAGWKRTEARQMPLAITPEGADPNVSALIVSDVAPPAMAAPPSTRADPNLSAPGEALAVAETTDALASEPLPCTLDRDPANRRMDRLFAYLGLIEDAAPLFASARAVPRVGVLLAIPALLESGVLEVARSVYGTLAPSFYGLRTTIVTLILMALLRIRKPEGLKESAPKDLGRIIGLDRAPEVKTLRRKLRRLAEMGRASAFGRELAVRRVAARGAAMGFLYVDGHVRVYHGKHRLPQAHVARMRLCMPATTDYWVNDTQGEPLFVVTAEANAGLVKMLPEILEHVRGLVGERRVTVVFDRGGYSPRLFQNLIADGFDVLTYRKGHVPRIARRHFVEHAAVLDGREVRYRLADQGVRLLDGTLRLRQVTRLSDDSQHQTPILTSRRDLSAVEVAFRMFERWRQENFFKYLRDEYALDALAEYAVEAADPTREVPNPACKQLQAKLRDARTVLEQLRAKYGRKAVENIESQRPTMRGFKIANGKLGQALRAAERKVANLEGRRAALPTRVPVAAAVSDPIVKLAPERKLLTNILKMVAYQVESDLVRQVTPHYRRADDEGRTLIQAALQCDADLEVGNEQMAITLAPMSAPHRTRAIAALCADLNRVGARFPGTRLRLVYAVRGPK